MDNIIQEILNRKPVELDAAGLIRKLLTFDFKNRIIECVSTKQKKISLGKPLNLFYKLQSQKVRTIDLFETADYKKIVAELLRPFQSNLYTLELSFEEQQFYRHRRLSGHVVVYLTVTLI